MLYSRPGLGAKLSVFCSVYLLTEAVRAGVGGVSERTREVACVYPRVLAICGFRPDVCLSSNTTHKQLEWTVASAVGPGHTGRSFQFPS
jgi:hypothetical protein